MPFFNAIDKVNCNICESVHSALSSDKKVITIGGDHAVSWGSIAGALKHNSEVGVIYLDAHGDCNIAERSASHHIHGMHMAYLMGFGEAKYVGRYTKNILPVENILYVGARSLDPFLSRRPDKHTFYAKLNVGSALIGALLLIIVSPWVIRIMLGDEFDNSIIVMQILSFSIVFLAMSYAYGTNYLIIHHKEKPLRNLTFISSIVGMCAAIPLVYFFSYIGAALTVFLCRGLLGVGSYILARKINNTK